MVVVPAGRGFGPGARKAWRQEQSLAWAKAVARRGSHSERRAAGQANLLVALLHGRRQLATGRGEGWGFEAPAKAEAGGATGRIAAYIGWDIMGGSNAGVRRADWRCGVVKEMLLVKVDIGKSRQIPPTDAGLAPYRLAPATRYVPAVRSPRETAAPHGARNC